MHVRLMADVEEEHVTRGLEDAVERDGQFDHAEVRTEVAARPGHGVDEELAYFRAQFAVAGPVEPSEVGG
ncbi:hypothetical protein GCM10010524_09510 [Streptomyces mexicanus]